jgi:hypothetical protein
MKKTSGGASKMSNATVGFPVLAVFIAALIGGCSSQGTATDSAAGGLIAARDKLVADIHQCSQRYGYDPNHVQGVAENALAPQELQWRQCAYDATRVYEQGNPAMKSQYEQLIAEDIGMTTAIQQGTMTRSQRRTRIETLVGQIKSAEEAQALATATEQERQMQQIRNVVESARGFAY